MVQRGSSVATAGPDDGSRVAEDEGRAATGAHDNVGGRRAGLKAERHKLRKESGGPTAIGDKSQGEDGGAGQPARAEGGEARPC